MKKPLYQYVMDCLGTSEETYQEIADGSGVPKRTIEKIARKEIGDPGVSTAQKLGDYFRSRGRKEAA